MLIKVDDKIKRHYFAIPSIPELLRSEHSKDVTN